MSWADNKARLREPWKAPFCGCFDDWSSCLLSFCCPCVQYGYNAEKVDGSGCFGACCMYLCCMMCAGYQCAIGGAKRTSLRNMYMLNESCCCDCCVHWCCCWCALSQEARELEIRGPPKQQTMGGAAPVIHINNSTNVSNTATGGSSTGNNSGMNSGMNTPTGSGSGMVYMPGPNGQTMPVPQHGTHYMVGPDGQPVMMMYAPQPGQPMMPMMYPGSPMGYTYAQQPALGTAIPMQTFNSTTGTPPPKPQHFEYDHQQQQHQQQAEGQGENAHVTTLNESTPGGAHVPQ